MSLNSVHNNISFAHAPGQEYLVYILSNTYSIGELQHRADGIWYLWVDPAVVLDTESVILIADKLKKLSE